MINYFAHRAKDNHSFKDNSKEAVKNVINKDYIKGIELDIRLTKDKKIVVYHDPIIILNKQIKLIKEINYINLYKTNIFLLEDILANINTNKIIILEIKYETKINKEDIKILINELNKYSLLNLYICSFNTKLIKNIKKNSNLKCGIIVGNIINRFKNKIDFSLIKYNLLFKIKSECFIWLINDKTKLNKIIKKNKFNNLNIITDNAYKLNSTHL